MVQIYKTKNRKKSNSTFQLIYHQLMEPTIAMWMYTRFRPFFANFPINLSYPLHNVRYLSNKVISYSIPCLPSSPINNYRTLSACSYNSSVRDSIMYDPPHGSATCKGKEIRYATMLSFCIHYNVRSYLPEPVPRPRYDNFERRRMTIS